MKIKPKIIKDYSIFKPFQREDLESISCELICMLLILQYQEFGCVDIKVFQDDSSAMEEDGGVTWEHTDYEKELADDIANDKHFNWDSVITEEDYSMIVSELLKTYGSYENWS